MKRETAIDLTEIGDPAVNAVGHWRWRCIGRAWNWAAGCAGESEAAGPESCGVAASESG